MRGKGLSEAARSQVVRIVNARLAVERSPEVVAAKAALVDAVAAAKEARLRVDDARRCSAAATDRFRSKAAEWDASVRPSVADEGDGDTGGVGEFASVTVRQGRSEPRDLTVTCSGLHHVDHVGFRCVVDAGADVLTVVVEVPSHGAEPTGGGV